MEVALSYRIYFRVNDSQAEGERSCDSYKREMINMQMNQKWQDMNESSMNSVSLKHILSPHLSQVQPGMGTDELWEATQPIKNTTRKQSHIAKYFILLWIAAKCNIGLAFVKSPPVKLHLRTILGSAWSKQFDVFIIYPDLSDWSILAHAALLFVSVPTYKTDAISGTFSLSQ